MTNEMTPRERVNCALWHQRPDRVPVDFLATPEVWQALCRCYGVESSPTGADDLYDPQREALLRILQVDCRVLSYDQFCSRPEPDIPAGAQIDWWKSPSRSTPNRMWRVVEPGGDTLDIWGRRLRMVPYPQGVYEEAIRCPLEGAASLLELRSHPWPKADWWDFRELGRAIDGLERDGEYHLRFRAGSVFETAWQLRGLERFMVDLAIDQPMAEYLMDRVLEVLLEYTEHALEAAGKRLDMVYFYDDVAAQTGLMISKPMWRKLIRPRHSKIVELAKRYGKQVMYHCDGAVRPLIPELIDLGIDVLNPVQRGVPGMDIASLKQELGDRLSFHGGIDIVRTLPNSSPDGVREEVRECVGILGNGGGYILSSSHHIQPDTPTENVLAMYEVDHRMRDYPE